MYFRLKALSKKAEDYIDTLKRERDTKYCLVEPFLRILGYDVSIPSIVYSEYNCGNVGQVDYALMQDDSPVALVEAKHCRSSLTQTNIKQLSRYFSVLDVKFALLTNGLETWFFTSLEGSFEMNEVPFYKFNLEFFDERDVAILSQFTYGNFTSLRLDSVSYNSRYKPVLYSYLLNKLRSRDVDLMGFLSSKLRTDTVPLETMINLLKEDLDSFVRDDTSLMNVLRSSVYSFEGRSREELLSILTDLRKRNNDHLKSHFEDDSSLKVLVTKATFLSENLRLKDVTWDSVDELLAVLSVLVSVVRRSEEFIEEQKRREERRQELEAKNRANKFNGLDLWK